MKIRIGIFGGSFNPVHNGHRLMAKEFLESRIVEELWILPAPDPPHKTESLLVPFKQRLEMLALAFEGEKNIEVMDVERDLAKPSYTLRTVEYLQEEYPGTIFFLCMGEDSLAGFESWYRYNEILKRVSLVVARRSENDSPKPGRNILRHSVMIENPVVKISSSHIRDTGMGVGQLPEKVEAYILEKNLYSEGDKGT